jgi:hypothetical protein
MYVDNQDIFAAQSELENKLVNEPKITKIDIGWGLTIFIDSSNHACDKIGRHTSQTTDLLTGVNHEIFSS